jgi:hypothetical protein
MKAILLSLLLLATGCGVNITQKSESSEPPTRISRVKVEFFQSQKTLYKIEKYSVASSPNAPGPKITDEEKTATEKTVAAFLQPLKGSVENVLSEKLRLRGVQIGEEYILRIFIDEIIVSVQGDKAIVKVAPRLNIKYSATLQRATDLNVLWRASFRRPNATTSTEDLQNSGVEIAEKIFSEFSGSGWIK